MISTTPLRALSGIIVATVVIVLGLANVTPAHADTPFWEADTANQSRLGHPTRASSKAHAHRHVAITSYDDERPARRARKHSRAASRTVQHEGARHHHHSGGGVTWTASSGCLNGTLAGIIEEVGSSYGPVTVNSTCRSHGHNAAVGGAPRSQHLSGNAVDFRVHGNVSGAIAFLRGNGSVGGFKHYGGGLFHIDTGARRTW